MIPRPLSAAVEPCHASLLMLGLICAAPAQEPRPTTATLMGRVVDPRGEPVVQAQVRAMAAFHDEPLVTQKTDGSGFFTLKGLPLDDTLQVAASAPGHARAAVWLTPTRQLETLDQDLTLRSAGNITGVVVDGSGQPIGGACVSAAAAFAQPRVEAVETTTDAQGRFALDAVPLGEVLLMAWKRGFVLQERQLLLRERCEEQLVLSDKGGARLAVRVEGLTSDADRASVKLRLQRFVDNWSQALPTPLGLCSLGESDSFTVDGLLPGQYQMIPHSPRVSVRVRSGEAPAAVPLLGMTATPRDAQLTLTEGAVQEVCFVAAAPAAVRISGVLGAADNFGIAGKLLRFSSTNGVRIPSVRTDSAGAFALTASLSVGETLWPRLLDDEHFLVADRLQGGALVEGKQVELRLTADKREEVRGRVLDADGAPQSGVRVAMSAVLLGRGNLKMVLPERHEFAVSRTDADGNFVLRWENQDRLDAMRVEASDARGCASVDLDQRALDNGVAVALRLAPAAQLEGVVRDPDGKPFGGVRLRLTSDGDLGPPPSRRGGIHAVTDRDGRYRFAPLAAAEYRLEATVRGPAPAETRTITIQSGERKTGVDLVVRP